MNKKLIFLIVSFLYMVTATAQPLLIPYPRSIEMREGYFVLTAKTGIINLSDKNNARLLKHYIEEDININLHEQRGDNNIIIALTILLLLPCSQAVRHQTLTLTCVSSNLTRATK